MVSQKMPGNPGDAPTVWKDSVRAKVTLGSTFGRTANEVSPTSPLVTLFKALWSMGSPILGATKLVSRKTDIMVLIKD